MSVLTGRVAQTVDTTIDLTMSEEEEGEVIEAPVIPQILRESRIT